MCWNKEVSGTAFLFGMYTSYQLYQVKQMKAESIVWAFISLMQLFEFFIWSNQECGELNKYATRGLMITNFMQPIVVLLSALYFNKYSSNIKIITISLTILYSLIVLIKYNELKKIECVEPSCKHLKYTWWNNVDSRYYIVIWVILLLLLWKNPISNALFLTIIGLIASSTFKSHIGSVWCLFAIMGPLFSKYAYHKKMY